MSQDIEVAFPPDCDGRDFAHQLDRLKHGTVADALSFRDRLAALNDLSDALLQPGAVVRQDVGLPFLAGFLRATNLEHLLAHEVPHPEAIERFTSLGGRKSLRIMPKGLVCHWIAGNVPLLGMFSWAISALVGNRNVIRISSRQEDLISPLLRQLAGLSDAGARLARETLLVYFDRENESAHRAMSAAADVRIAWGGEEAVSAIQNLPCEWDCETVTLGPRVSLAVADPALLTDRVMGRLVTDVVYFDQLACSSPQYLFLKGKPGEPAFDDALDGFTTLFGNQAKSIVRHPLDFGETYRIQLDRARILLDGGQLLRDDATRWTVAVVESPHDRVACMNRFLQVIPFAGFEEIYPHIPRNVQTVVTLLDESDTAAFTERAAQCGVCRFPRPGEGNHFENPWDGIPLISRLTRWVLRTDARD